MRDSLESPPRSSGKSYVLNLVVSFAIFGWLLHQIDFQQLVNGLRGAQWNLLIAGTLVMAVGIGLRAWRWQLLVNKDDAVMSFPDAAALTLIGCALNVLLPASMGDVAKSYYAYRRGGAKETMFSASVVDKAMGMLAGFAAGFPLAGLLGLWEPFWLGLILCLALSLILFFPRVLPWGVLSWLAARIGKRFEAGRLLAAATLSPTLLLASFTLSVLAWVCNYLQFWLAFRAFGEDPGLGHVFALTPVIMLTKLIPFTLDGLGAQEALSVSLFLRLGGVSKSVTLLATLATRALTSWLPAFIGVGLMVRERRRWAARPAPAVTSGETAAP